MYTIDEIDVCPSGGTKNHLGPVSNPAVRVGCLIFSAPNTLLPQQSFQRYDGVSERNREDLWATSTVGRA